MNGGQGLVLHSTRRAAAGAVLALGCLLVVMTSAYAAPQAPEPPPGTSPPDGAEAPQALPTFKVRSLDSALAQLVGVARSDGATAARRFASSRGLELGRGGVDVIVVARDSRPASLALVRRAVRDAGGRVGAAYRELTSARVPVAALRALAASRGVLEVRQPVAPQPDEMVGEGVAEMAANVWAAAGLDGTGVKVGIIDVGFKGYQDLLGSELPAQVVTWGQSSAGPEGGPSDTQTHGTAVAEVVHDVAPGAQLYLARYVNSGSAGEVELGLAEEWLVSQGVQVINYSACWYGHGNDGSGTINDVVNDAVSHDVFWANGAGNYRRMHWMGDFTDPDGDSWLDWDGVGGHWSNTFVAREGDPMNGSLWWDDSWTAATQDYDLGLAQWDRDAGKWVLLASSTGLQSGLPGQRPIEIINVDAAPAWTWYAWEVQRASATRTDVDFDLLSTTHTLDNPKNSKAHYFTHARSILSPADNASAGFMAAAAIGRAPEFAQADYSSEGPTRDGRITPEISGPTDVWSVIFQDRFAGTSAASPHVAGIAAILRQAYPSYSAAQTEALIKACAVDLSLADPEPDNIFGWGRILLPDVPTDTTRPITVALPASVKKGKLATLRFRVDDAGFSAGPAVVTIQIENGKGKVVKKLGPLGGRPMCQPLAMQFTCTLPKGTYKFRVLAVDAAGNRAVRVGSARLTVK